MSTPLFSPHIGPFTVLLPETYAFRPLQRDDYHNGHLEVLGDLAFIGSITEERWTQRFDHMVRCPGTYFVLVIVKDGKVVGSGTLVAETKFLFELGVQGHIEDIVIAKAEQGKGLGLALLNGLNEIAKNLGCYKTILDCSAKNIAFYEKCGFEVGGHEMQHYINMRAKEHHV